MILLKSRFELWGWCFLKEHFENREQLREQFWKMYFWLTNFKMSFLDNVSFEQKNLKKVILSKQIWKWLFEEAILKMYFYKMDFLMEQFWKIYFWVSNFKNIFLERAIFKIYILRESFCKMSFFKMSFFEVETLI